MNGIVRLRSQPLKPSARLTLDFNYGVLQDTGLNGCDILCKDLGSRFNEVKGGQGQGLRLLEVVLNTLLGFYDSPALLADPKSDPNLDSGPGRPACKGLLG